MSRSRIVVSRSTLTRLAPAELGAVLEHERSHLRARHDLVLEAFTVLHLAFPRWVASASARREVEVLVEVLADRAACRTPRDRRALASALLTLAGSPAPAGSLGSAGSSLAARVEVLRDTRPHPWQSAAVSVLAAAHPGAAHAPGGAALAQRPRLTAPYRRRATRSVRRDARGPRRITPPGPSRAAGAASAGDQVSDARP